MRTDQLPVKLKSNHSTSNMGTDPKPVINREDFQCDPDPELRLDLLDVARAEELIKERKREEARKAFALQLTGMVKAPEIIRVASGTATEPAPTTNMQCETDPKVFTDFSIGTEAKELKHGSTETDPKETAGKNTETDVKV
jgi:hypothetical protein